VHAVQSFHRQQFDGTATMAKWLLSNFGSFFGNVTDCIIFFIFSVPADRFRYCPDGLSGQPFPDAFFCRKKRLYTDWLPTAANKSQHKGGSGPGRIPVDERISRKKGLHSGNNYIATD
jgi:hypothetical protein